MHNWSPIFCSFLGFFRFREREAGLVRVHVQRRLAPVASRATDWGAQRGGLERRYVGTPQRCWVPPILSGEISLADTPPHRCRHSSWPRVPPPCRVQTRCPRPSRDFQHTSLRKLRAADSGFWLPKYRDARSRALQPRNRCVLFRGDYDGIADWEDRVRGDRSLGEEIGEGRAERGRARLETAIRRGRLGERDGGDSTSWVLVYGGVTRKKAYYATGPGSAQGHTSHPRST